MLLHSNRLKNGVAQQMAKLAQAMWKKNTNSSGVQRSYKNLSSLDIVETIQGSLLVGLKTYEA